jgi:hypothetical protein
VAWNPRSVAAARVLEVSTECKWWDWLVINRGCSARDVFTVVVPGVVVDVVEVVCEDLGSVDILLDVCAARTTSAVDA